MVMNKRVVVEYVNNAFLDQHHLKPIKALWRIILLDILPNIPIKINLSFFVLEN